LAEEAAVEEEEEEEEEELVVELVDCAGSVGPAKRARLGAGAAHAEDAEDAITRDLFKF
jgi:hypothetical protein